MAEPGKQTSRLDSSQGLKKGVGGTLVLYLFRNGAYRLVILLLRTSQPRSITETARDRFTITITTLRYCNFRCGARVLLSVLRTVLRTEDSVGMYPDGTIRTRATVCTQR